MQNTPGIDFRSDTITWPTPEMREAMATAAVGDDVYGEDPTVNELQAEAASRLGKDEGLFVASGTMGNLIAILVHAGRGDEAIVGDEAHTIQWEVGGMATLGGIVPRVLPTDAEGRMDLGRVEGAVRGDDPHLPHSRLILVENSFGGRGGWPIAPDYFRGIRQVAERHGLTVHLDGARLFNAAVALGRDAADLTRDVDSVTFCLSKGLCAPVGSVLCGSRAFIAEAKRVRKSLGGGMRQAGILASAGLVALRSMVPRLVDDHVNARRLADALAEIPGVRIDPARVRTNIVYFELDPAAGVPPDRLVARLADEHGMRIGMDGPVRIRAVTHYWVGEREVSALTDAVAGILAG